MGAKEPFYKKLTGWVPLVMLAAQFLYLVGGYFIRDERFNVLVSTVEVHKKELKDIVGLLIKHEGLIVNNRDEIIRIRNRNGNQ